METEDNGGLPPIKKVKEQTIAELKKEFEQMDKDALENYLEMWESGKNERPKRMKLRIKAAKEVLGK